MVGWHHRLNGHELEQTPGDSGQGNLVCCGPWGHKEVDTTERLNTTSNAQREDHVKTEGEGHIQANERDFRRNRTCLTPS